MSRKGESSKSSKSTKASKSSSAWTNDPQRVLKTSVGRRSATESRSAPVLDINGSDANVVRVFQHLGSVAKSGTSSSRRGGGKSRGSQSK